MDLRSRSLALSLVAVTALTGCSASDALPGDDAEAKAVTQGPSEVLIRPNVRAGARQVGLEKKIVVRAQHGTLESVTLKGPQGVVRGRLAPDGTSWRSVGRLAQDKRYVLTTTAVDSENRSKRQTVRFHTRELTLDEQTYPSFVPMSGSTVGVGMPAIIRFDVPVQDKAAIERHLKVTSQPAQPGAFHWISDQEVHWRPKNYWQPGTRVTVKADVGGVPAGNGIYGQLDRENTFTVGRSQVVKVDAASHRMKVFRDGKLVNDFPITTGKPGHTTRSGTKVIIEKFPSRRMNSETVGIPVNSSDGYDLDDVQWAMRLTYSGEFIHAAPWSVGSQGRANVSHGCTGMSTANAKWLYDNTLIGDPIEYTGTDRGMTLSNGYGDWNLGFNEYAAG
ncbi:MAG: hypothetical protein EOO70_05765, partial [Myxococcaceae bacterium]